MLEKAIHPVAWIVTSKLAFVFLSNDFIGIKVLGHEFHKWARNFLLFFVKFVSVTIKPEAEIITDKV